MYKTGGNNAETYDKKIKGLSASSRINAEEIKNSTKGTKALSKGFLEAAASTEKMTLSTKLSTVAMNAFNIAKSVALNVGIMLALQAAATGIDYLVHYNENLAKAAEESSAKLEETKNKLKSLNDEYTTTQSRIRELEGLKAKGNISFIEEEELTKLKLSNIELKVMITNLKEQKALEADDSKKKANKAFNSENKNDKDRKNRNTERDFQLIHPPNPFDTEYEDLLKEPDYSTDLEYLVAMLNKTKIGTDAFKTAETALQEEIKKLNAIIGENTYNHNNQLSELDKEMNSRIDMVIQAKAKLSAANGDVSLAISTLLTDGKFAPIGESIISGKKIDESSKSFGELKIALTALGIPTDNIIAKFQEFASKTEEIKEEVDSLKKTVAEFSDITAISTTESAFGSLNAVLKEFKENHIATASSLLGLKETFKDISGFQDYVNVLGNSKSSLDEVKSATEQLALAYLSEKNVLEEINDGNKELMVSQLQAIGVTNAEEIVIKQARQAKIDETMATLKQKDATLDLTTTTATQIQSLYQECGVALSDAEAQQILSNAKISSKVATLDFATATSAQVQLIAQEYGVTLSTAEAQSILTNEKLKAKIATFDFTKATSSSVGTLLNEATAAKADSGYLAKLYELKIALVKLEETQAAPDSRTRVRALDIAEEKVRRLKEELKNTSTSPVTIKTYVPPPKLNFDLDSLGGSKYEAKDTGKGSEAKDTKDYWKEAFEKEYKALKHQLEMKLISEEDYFSTLDGLNKKYFANNEKYLDEYTQYEEEVFKGREKLLEEAEQKIRDLIDLRIEYIKKQKDLQKQAIEEEIKGKKKIIDLQKEAISLQKEERDYARELSDKQKIVSDIQLELISLEKDDSAEATKRKLELAEELKEKQLALDDLIYNNSVEKEQDALDKEYEAFEIEKQKELDKIQEFLDNSFAIREQAMADLNGMHQNTLNELIEYNKIYGTGIEADVTQKWNDAYDALKRYGDLNSIVNSLKSIDDSQINNAYTGGSGGSGNGSSYVPPASVPQNNAGDFNIGDRVKVAKGMSGNGASDGSGGSAKSGISNRTIMRYIPGRKYPYLIGQNNVPTGWYTAASLEKYHTGGEIKTNTKLGKDFAKLINSKIGEVPIMAQQGEMVVTRPQVKNLLNKIIPSVANTSNNSNSEFVVNFGDINISGSVDKNVLEELKHLPKQWEKELLDSIERHQRTSGFNPNRKRYG